MTTLFPSPAAMAMPRPVGGDHGPGPGGGGLPHAAPIDLHALPIQLHVGAGPGNEPSDLIDDGLRRFVPIDGRHLTAEHSGIGRNGLPLGDAPRGARSQGGHRLAEGLRPQQGEPTGQFTGVLLRSDGGPLHKDDISRVPAPPPGAAR